MISDEEMAVLAEVQRLPLVASPFAEVAKRLNMKEKKVLEICKDLLSKGVIRRFATSLNHRRIGIHANLMVVVNVPEEQVDEIGEAIANEEGITHCYYRTGWDYNLFYMIHSNSKEEVVKRAIKMMKKLGITDFKYMFSTKEFKKTSFEVPKPLSNNSFNEPFQIPLILNLSGPVIIFGGGKVGQRKVDFISKFTRDIKVITKTALKLPDFVELHTIELRKSDISKYIPSNAALVIAALSNSLLNEEISKYCINHNVLVNIVDDPNNSTVIFPALSKIGNLNIAISTEGKCPFISKEIRKYWDSIGTEWADWIEILAPIRDRLNKMQEKKSILSKIFDNDDIRRQIKNKNLIKAKKQAERIYDANC
ncbi:MAG: NAD(P)-dependent oxidoreductase [Candidatus Thorarchaeota archaeon]